MDPTREAERLYTEITTAFAEVALGDGVGLWEAQAIDDYAEPTVRRSARERDEKHDWSVIPAKDLDECYSSPSFFDPEGMRFHLPALMLADLSGSSQIDVTFFLTRLDDWSLEKFQLLNDAQRNAVRRFLEFQLRYSDGDFDHPSIEQALQTFWNK